MVKWIFLLFVAALVVSGWWASQDDAPGWAPVMPTLVIAAGVISGIVYAIRWALRRRKEMAAVAAQMGFAFENERPALRESGIGVLKQFAHCRPQNNLPFLSRGMRVSFSNVLSTHFDRAEVYLLDYTTSRGKGSNYHGLFACFRQAGQNVPDLEIVPRLWGQKPQWMRWVVELPPARRDVAVDHSAFGEEYIAYGADEAAARSILDSRLLGHLAEPRQPGWRIEASGEWVAVTRLGPGKMIGGLTDPMEPEKISAQDRYSYHQAHIAPRHLPTSYEQALHLYRLITQP